MKALLNFILFFQVLVFPVFSQVQWNDTTLKFSDITWENYSTTFLGEGSDSIPLLVAAIPYNGVYNFGDGSDKANKPLDISFNGAAFRFRSNLENGQLGLETYDSSEVYFLAPGIFPSNANRFEYRILLNGITEFQPWSSIKTFTNADFTLNSFRPGFAFLGGYKVPWDNYLVLELRQKGHAKLVASAAIFWKQVRPALSAILTSQEMNERFLQMKNIFEPQEFPGVLDKWKKLYAPEELDSVSGLPLRLVLAPGEKELFFFLNAAVYKKDAIEYKLTRDNKIISNWVPNTVDNAFIWLRNLSPGKYSLGIRYSKQRHNTLLYEFEIQPFWYQRRAFIILMAIFTACFIGLILMVYLLYKQRKKTRFEVTRKEVLELKVKSIYAQLNPHFIFNALNSIQALINKNDQDGANRYLSSFGEIVRYALSGTEKMLVPFPQEINLIETYLCMEQLRFYFNYSINMAEDIAIGDWEIPALLLQPLVENAVKHGISGMNENGNIRILINTNGDELMITITDNGKGFQPYSLIEGYGLKLTRERIKILNEHFNARVITLSINSDHALGTSIQLQLKNYRV